MRRFLLVATAAIVNFTIIIGATSAVAQSQGERFGAIFYDTGNTNEKLLIQRFDRIRGAGFKRITIPYWGCQPDSKSSEVGACELISEDRYAYQAKIAMSRGLKVSFLPIVGTLTGEWRGLFKPKDVPRWFQTYGAWITKVAREAQILQMEELVAGTEFSVFLFQQDAHWKALLRDLRSSFGGRLVVTTNWDHPDFKFWSEADAFGVSAYFPLSSFETHDPNRLLNGAIQNRETMRGKASRAGKPLHITEFGFPSLSTAATKPYHYPQNNEPYKVDQALQAKCYEAFLKSWVMSGGGAQPIAMNAWASGDPAHELAVWNFEFLGKPAEAIIRGFINQF
ncbi:MAG TPA: hypothetical protein VFV50_18710 [Bdellovibrionales bacterium]|nr:hypothetical protein [Bdellovibrionales bacterium]